MEGRAHGVLAANHLAQGDHDQGVEHARQALALLTATGTAEATRVASVLGALPQGL